MAVKKLQKRGFTLIELLVVITITGVVGTMVVNLFLINLRASTKTKMLTAVKQNGDFAVLAMERIIRNSQEIITCSGNSIQIKGIDDGITTFKLYNNARVASGSAYLTSSDFEVKNNTWLVNCQAVQGKPTVVEINFTLKQAGAVSGKEFEVEIPFSLKVSTRNY